MRKSFPRGFAHLWQQRDSVARAVERAVGIPSAFLESRVRVQVVSWLNAGVV
jgi:hypothetical protein